MTAPSSSTPIAPLHIPVGRVIEPTHDQLVCGVNMRRLLGQVSRDVMVARRARLTARGQTGILAEALSLPTLAAVGVALGRQNHLMIYECSMRSPNWQNIPDNQWNWMEQRFYLAFEGRLFGREGETTRGSVEHRFIHYAKRLGRRVEPIQWETYPIETAFAQNAERDMAVIEACVIRERALVLDEATRVATKLPRGVRL